MSTIKRKISFSIVMLFFAALYANGQTIPVYKIDNLLQRVHNQTDTVYVVNFWATWCKPCVMELPEFEKFSIDHRQAPIKVLLVSMDFKEDIDKKLKPFLEKNKLTSEVVLLDEVDGNVFINKISPQWSGAIPATYFTYKQKTFTKFIEKKLDYAQLQQIVTEVPIK